MQRPEDKLLASPVRRAQTPCETIGLLLGERVQDGYTSLDMPKHAVGADSCAADRLTDLVAGEGQWPSQGRRRSGLGRRIARYGS
jgi:hypothetical protein